jgi:hypothetical protein
MLLTKKKETIVIDTENLSEQALEIKYNLPVVDSFEVSAHSALLFWPTDQALQPSNKNE